MYVLNNCSTRDDANGITLCLSILDKYSANLFNFLKRKQDVDDNAQEQIDLRHSNEAEISEY